LNWRRVEDKQEYPHYSKIKPIFEHHLIQYFEFLEGEGLSRPEPTDYELTYVNIVPVGQEWEKLSDFGAILPDICWRQTEKRFLPTPKGLSSQASFELPNDA